MQSHKRTIILLLDDDALTRHITRLLGSAYVVAGARNARGAVAMIERDPQIAAVITEQAAGSGDAVESLEAIRLAHPQVRRIMLTSYNNLASIVHGLHSGAVQALVQKPVANEDLLAALCIEVSHAPSSGVRRSA